VASTPTEAVALFLLDCEARRLEQSTIIWYRSKLNHFTTWLAGENVSAIDQVDTPMLRRYLTTLRETSIQHQHNCGRTLRRFFRFLIDENILTVAPTVAQPRLPRTVLPALTEDQVKTVLKHCDERDRAVVLTFLDSGIRAGELCALNVSDVDLTTGAVFVRKGKGAKTRVSYVGVHTCRAIGDYLAERQPRANEPLFPNKTTGRRLTVAGIVQLMERLREASGVDTLTAHALRRTFAITALRGGMDVHMLARLMGHADTQVLWRYLDIVDRDLKEAHARVRPVDQLLK
jgi:integrase/recombinase XerC/integrase/recombinase XerD